eukprot:EG_transcript_1132
MVSRAHAPGYPPLRPSPFRPLRDGLAYFHLYHPWSVPNPAATSPLRTSVTHVAEHPSAENPPRRPLSSSSPDRTASGSNSDVTKPSHTTIEKEDTEALGIWEGGEGEHTNEMAARQLARTMGTESFFNAFHERYPGRRVPTVALPDILAAAGLTVSEEAVAKVCPEMEDQDNVAYPMAQDLYLRLKAEQRQLATRLQEPAKAGCLSRWMATDRDAANLLLLIVVALCGLSAFLAAGVAILLLFLDGLDTVSTRLQEDLGVFQDILDVYAKQIAVQTDYKEEDTFATTLSVVLQYIGYIASVKQEGSDILKMATAVSNTMAAWLSTGPEKAFIGLASLAAVLTNTTVASYGLDQTRAALNGINSGGMTSNYEVVLARWLGNATTAVEYLTTFRYTSQCPKRVCVTNATVMAPMMAALAGSTFAHYVMDYRAATAFAGFTSTMGLGVSVQVSQSGLSTKRFNQVTNIMQRWTSASTNSYEYLVAKTSAPGLGSLMVAPQNCDSDCQQLILTPGWPMYNALLGQTGVMQFTNHRGKPAMAAYTPVDGQALALVVQMELRDITTQVLAAVVSLLNRLNTQYAEKSQEFELSTFNITNGNTTTTHLTLYRFSGDCPNGQCVETQYVQLAAANCSTGVMNTTDYRGKPVVVGYTCISELNAVVSVKVDVDDNTADTLQALLKAVDSRTAEDTTTSAQYLLATPRAGLTAPDVHGYGDFVVRSKLKYPEACVHPNCTWDSESALRALRDDTDVIETLDYRNVAVKAAPTLSTAVSYGIGLALETDTHELLQPMVDTAIKVGCFAIAMVVLGTLVLILVTRLFLKSMISAKEEGRQAVEKEKDRFSKLVSSMYPAYLVPQLLAGEKQMVCEVPGAAVFFSDIHEFTSASNAMNSQQLLQLMGYVYGVMDRIAHRFGVYKVKTIGDAYLAVHGLPGTASVHVALDLLRFASCVCQVFGDRFVHPTEGQVLATMNKAMSWNGRLSQAKSSSVGSASHSPPGTARVGGGSGPRSAAVPSQRSGSRLSGQASTSMPESMRRSQGTVQCVMSYGLATGRLVAGVLASRCPMFDVWGTPVNLASRMQSTGEPGRIQVSEQLYRKVMEEAGQPFSFEPPRSVFCKGFGTVNAYLVRATAEGLPKDLQAELRLEPRYGEFFFTNILSTAPAEALSGKVVV